MTLSELNGLSAAEAGDLFRSCCGASSWVARMDELRPFASRNELFAAADDVWNSLTESDWLEAFRHHPRIGESASAAPQSDQAREWSAGEQATVTRASESIRLAQRDMNAQYERRFGYIYIVCATGKSPNKMFAIARDRLSNDPSTEMHVAAGEQRKIMRLRLEKLLEDRS